MFFWKKEFPLFSAFLIFKKKIRIVQLTCLYFNINIHQVQNILDTRNTEEINPKLEVSLYDMERNEKGRNRRKMLVCVLWLNDELWRKLSFLSTVQMDDVYHLSGCRVFIYWSFH